MFKNMTLISIFWPVLTITYKCILSKKKNFVICKLFVYSLNKLTFQALNKTLCFTFQSNMFKVGFFIKNERITLRLK